MSNEDILKGIVDSLEVEKDALLKSGIDKYLKNYKITENNLSPELMSIIMAQQSSRMPIPEKREIPSNVDNSEEISLINVDASRIVNDLLVGNNVYLYGVAGTGKTTLAKKIATQILYKQFYLLNCNQFTSPINIIGGQTIDGYKQGILIEAWENGGMFIADELPKLDPNTAGLLNDALAQSADQEKTYKISEEKYYELLSQKEKYGRYPGFEVYEKDGEFYQDMHVTITDGKGDKVRKGKDFCVIGTGNTDMKTVGNNFSGNNRQDYSLVDRFAGSYYKVGYDVPLEKRLTYSLVYDVSVKIREVLSGDPNSVESVSLRTMLNFNRIYEQEYLRKIESKFAQEVPEIAGVKGKTFQESVDSFLETLPATKRETINMSTDVQALLVSATPVTLFIEEFKRIHGVDPISGEFV